MTETPLDRAFARMMSEGSDAAHLAFHERLADAELFVLLEVEAEGDMIQPTIFDTSEARFLVAFDREERLADFAGGAPYAGLSGRVLVGLVAGQGLGIALNPEVAPSSTVIAPEAVEWLADLLDEGPGEGEARIASVAAPKGLPEVLLGALDQKLAAGAGLARKAYLAAATYEGGGQGHLLAFTGAPEGAEPALAQAVQEALVFSGLEAGALDVTFMSEDSPLVAELSRVALGFDLPDPVQGQGLAPSAPGMDPEKPPRLR